MCCPRVFFGAVISIKIFTCAFAYSEHFAFLKLEWGADFGRSRLVLINHNYKSIETIIFETAVKAMS